MVLRFQRYVRKRSEVTSQGFELLVTPDTGQELLSHGAQHGGSAFPHQLGELPDLCVDGWSLSAKRE